jgi:hypothetical protein
MTLDLSPLPESVNNLTQHLTHGFQSVFGHKYGSICHRSSTSLNLSLAAPLASTPCFTFQSSSPRSFTQTLLFAPGTRDDFMASLTRHTKFTDESGVRFEIEARQVENEER